MLKTKRRHLIKSSLLTLFLLHASQICADDCAVFSAAEAGAASIAGFDVSNQTATYATPDNAQQPPNVVEVAEATQQAEPAQQDEPAQQAAAGEDTTPEWTTTSPAQILLLVILAAMFLFRKKHGFTPGK